MTLKQLYKHYRINYNWYGSKTELAKALTDDGFPVTRQGVSIWHKRGLSANVKSHLEAKK